jgi:hypothetical protein
LNNTPATLSPFNPWMLQPGDCLLYAPSDVFDWGVVLKTWTRVSHVEVFIGDSYSVASRNGKGVGKYPVRLDHVAAVRRPGPQFDLAAAMNWFGTVDGQKYGWRTLLSFVLLNNNPIEGHMICSEFTAGFYRAGKNPLFAADWPDYRTPPSLEVATPSLTTIWDNGKVF